MPTTPMTFQDFMNGNGGVLSGSSRDAKRRAFDITTGENTSYEWEDVIGFSGHQMQRGLDGLLELSFDRQQQNTQNRRRGEAFAQSVYDANSGPTITNDDINTMFAQQADMGAGDFLANNNAISESVGIRGVSGGIAADLAVQSHQQFQQNLAQAKGNIRIAKIQSDASDAMRNLNFGFNLGNFMAAPEDETDLAGITAWIEGTGQVAGLRAQAESIRDAAKNAKRGANMSLAGSIIGGGLSLAGGL